MTSRMTVRENLESFYELRLGRHVRARTMDSLKDLRTQTAGNLIVAGHRPFYGEAAQSCDIAGHG